MGKSILSYFVGPNGSTEAIWLGCKRRRPEPSRQPITECLVIGKQTFEDSAKALHLSRSPAPNMAALHERSTLSWKEEQTARLGPPGIGGDV